ncbi:hypothetical protein HYH03_014793 [Edaphochlamys debaryana]|uniref:O-phosphoseryl-tRNA(Sec) selenium transferase n=1 Tax=Edaphochlamys debaryana TaxID=47281 RepID=A0A836BRS4_9CHLO|nr:hypothetical protein HYH03_014793 [Edaphochlamys debaryana]|eukprot:KAG2486490.1 hypothetical protein HYH03_014793 [Edaphochlamys debaryana]
MNPANLEAARGLVSASYLRQGGEALAARQRRVKALLSSRRLPEQGWDEATLDMFIRDCSAMDSNNFPGNVGVGEREGRLACPAVARRHFGLAHGVGRSGDIAAEQPKAAGSSLLAALAAALAADALRIAGLVEVGPVAVLPLATGMALALSLMGCREQRPPGADVVIWSRVDQKTALKAVTAAGLTPHVVQLVKRGDELVTDTQAISAALASLGPDRVVAVLTTSSCFAPRAPDDLEGVARLCAAAGVPHVVNNAYGVQSAATCAALTAACRRGRVDAIVQSTDKNFMVPVGGALVAAPRSRPALVAALTGAYPGRAAMGPALDLVMTLLHWGAEGWRQVLARREEVYPHLRSRLAAFAAGEGERVLETPGNPISIALTLDTLEAAARSARERQQAQHGTAQQPQSPDADAPGSGASPPARAAGAEGRAGAQSGAQGGGGGKAKGQGKAGAGKGKAGAGGPSGDRARAVPDATFFGAMLWSRCVSGTRVVAPGKTQSVAGVAFRNYGSHVEEPYPHTYCTAAAALGTTKDEVDEFIVRLGKSFADFRKKCGASSVPAGPGNGVEASGQGPQEGAREGDGEAAEAAAGDQVDGA